MNNKIKNSSWRAINHNVINPQLVTPHVLVSAKLTSNTSIMIIFNDACSSTEWLSENSYTLSLTNVKPCAF